MECAEIYKENNVILSKKYRIKIYSIDFSSFHPFPGVWLAAFNSVANPFVYALLMPTYRKCVINTFCQCAEILKRATPSKEFALSNVDNRKECIWRHHMLRLEVVFTAVNRGRYLSVQIINVFIILVFQQKVGSFYCCFCTCKHHSCVFYFLTSWFLCIFSGILQPL